MERGWRVYGSASNHALSTLQHAPLCKLGGEFCAFCATERVVGLMFRVDRSGAFSPNSIAQNISALGRQFRVGRQEDSHEFIRCLLERMVRASLRIVGVKEGAPGRLDETTTLHDIFGGYFRNQVHCTTCGFDSNSYDSFLDLSLEVGHDLPSVGAALRHFCKPETLGAWRPRVGGRRGVCANAGLPLQTQKTCGRARAAAYPCVR